MPWRPVARTVLATASSLHRLQQTAGNQAVSRMLKGSTAAGAQRAHLAQQESGLPPDRGAFLDLQRLAGNAAVAGMAGLAPPVAQRFWPFSSSPPRSQAELIRDGAGGDTDAIEEITDFTPASETQRLAMVRALLHQIYVGSRSERALERIWASFGDRLLAVASTPDNGRLFVNSTVRHSGLMAAIPVANRITSSFVGDVRAVAQNYLRLNAAFLTTESARLGLGEGAQPTADQDRIVGGLQTAATEVAKLQLAQQAARRAFVGWRRQIVANTAGIRNWRRVTYDPDSGPPEPTVPRERFETTYFWDDANERWADAAYDTELLAREQDEVRPYQQIHRDHGLVETKLTEYFTLYPALSAVAQGGPAGTTAFAAADSPHAARNQLRTRFAEVRASIRDAEDKLAGGDIDPLDLTPIHARLQHGQVPSASGVDYSTPLAQGLVGRQVLGHNIHRALRQLVLQDLSALAVLLAPLTEGASMVLLMSAGTLAAGTNLALDGARYQALLAAQRGTPVPATEMVERGAVDEARMAVEADMVAFGLAAVALGGAVAARTLQALREAARARLLRQIGQPTTVTLVGRAGELPYREPPGTMVIRSGEPLDFGRLDDKRRYLWLVDTEGNWRICPEDTGGFFPGRKVAKHGDLAAPTGPVPPQPEIPGAARRAAARAGGEFVAERGPYGRPTGRWVMNNDSSYTFARDDGTRLGGESLDAVRRLLGSTGTDISRVVLPTTSGAR